MRTNEYLDQNGTDPSPEPGQVVALYKANQGPTAEKPELLLRGLNNSHSLVAVWDGERLVGLSNALSDGFLVVYYPHLLVLTDY